MLEQIKKICKIVENNISLEIVEYSFRYVRKITHKNDKKSLQGHITTRDASGAEASQSK